MLYQRFYARSYPGSRPKEYTDFIESRYYTSFAKFGRYLVNIDAIQPEEFADFLLRCEAPMNQWENAAWYETYIRERTKKESAEKAVERNMLLMQQWSMRTGEHWTEFFRKITPALATMWIRSGRISPWVLYTAPSASDLLGRLTAEQLAMVKEYIDPEFWEHKFRRHQDDMNIIKQELTKAGL